MEPMLFGMAFCRATLPDANRAHPVMRVSGGMEFSTSAEGAPGMPILFLHGLGGDASNWKPQLDAFADVSPSVAWTMPGYGSSEPLAQMSFANLANAAVGLLDQLGHERVGVVGLSMGGYIAQRMAIDHPDRVERLVLCGTTAAFGKPGSSFNEQFLASRLAPLDAGASPASLAEKIVAGLLGPEPHAAAAPNAVASMERITADAYRLALSTLVTWDARDEIPQITQPTLCLAGAEDATAPVRAMQRLADAVPEATLEILDRCGHLMNLERPDAFNRSLRAFLAES